MPNSSMSKMKNLYKYSFVILKLGVAVFLITYFIDILRYLDGMDTFMIHSSHKINDVFFLFLIIVIVYIFIFTIHLIFEHQWKKIISIAIIMVVVFFVSLYLLNTFSEKANNYSINYIAQIFSKKNNYTIKCDDDIKKEYNLFAKSFDINAVKAIRHYPIHGRHIFVVNSKGAKPFIIEITRSFDKKMFAWIHKKHITTTP